MGTEDEKKEEIVKGQTQHILSFVNKSVESPASLHRNPLKVNELTSERTATGKQTCQSNHYPKGVDR